MLRQLTYVCSRLIQIIPVALLIILANFFLLKLAPGDISEIMAGEMGAATPEFMAELRTQFGTDQSLLAQLLHYYQKLLSFDLGYSFRNGMEVTALIADRLPATAMLAGASLALAVLLGVGLGWLGANTRRAWLKNVVSVFTSIGFATPLFWVGLMLIVFFSIHLKWLPTGGVEDLDAEYQGFERLADIGKHMIMPVLSLTLFYVAIYARITRAAIKDVQKLDFVRTAKAKGIGKHRVSIIHVLRNALLPVVTVTGMQIGSILSGSVVVETVFAWPGMGRLAFDAVMQRDLNLLLGVLFCSSLVVMFANIMTDLVYARLDPRIELK